MQIRFRGFTTGSLFCVAVTLLCGGLFDASAEPASVARAAKGQAQEGQASAGSVPHQPQAPLPSASPAPPTPSPTSSTKNETLDVPKLLARYGEVLSALPSDADALTVFTTKLGPASGLAEVAAQLKAQSRVPDTASSAASSTNPPIERSAIRYVAALSRWELAQAMRTAFFGTDEQRDPDLLTARQAQVTWLVGGETASPLAQLRPLVDTSTWARSLPVAEVEHPTYDGYRASVDRAYPDFAGSETAWLPAIERDGPAVVKQRLISEVIGTPVPESARAQMAARYVAQRLRPLLDARMQTLVAELEREAVVSTYAEWQTLRGARDRAREAAGLKRLCGTWQWTIHNHRNHGDQKTSVAFAPPGSEQAGTLRPTEVVVLGDAVYLRWELPGGLVQEDSLLFIGEGRRLEGSFVASGGSWGNITGKRTQGCKIP